MNFKNRKIIGMGFIFLFSVFKIHTLSEDDPLPNHLPILQTNSDYTMAIGKWHSHTKKQTFRLLKKWLLKMTFKKQ